MAEERGEFKIVVNVRAKLEIWQHCEFVKVKDEVSKTKIACRHCQIELKYSGNISNFSDYLTRKHSAVFLLFFVTSIFSFSHNQCSRRQSKSSTLILSIIFLKVVDRNCRLFHSQKQRNQFAESACIRHSSDIKLNNTSKYLG